MDLSLTDLHFTCKGKLHSALYILTPTRPLFLFSTSFHQQHIYIYITIFTYTYPHFFLVYRPSRTFILRWNHLLMKLRQLYKGLMRVLPPFGVSKNQPGYLSQQSIQSSTSSKSRISQFTSAPLPPSQSDKSSSLKRSPKSEQSANMPAVLSFLSKGHLKHTRRILRKCFNAFWVKTMDRLSLSEHHIEHFLNPTPTSPLKHRLHPFTCVFTCSLNSGPGVLPQPGTGSPFLLRHAELEC